MTPEVPEELAKLIRSQIEAWKAELGVLRRDPRVRQFLSLQNKLNRTDAFMVEASKPPLSHRSWPFDPYDAFEFARDLSGKEISTVALSKLAYGRFPDMSDASRQLMVHFLIDNGFAEVARKTSIGRPTWYRFQPRGNAGMKASEGNFVIPTNELSALKTHDLEDVVVRLFVPREKALEVAKEQDAASPPQGRS